MGPKTQTVVAAAIFMVVGVTLLALARAEESFVLGATGGYLLAFVIAFSREGQRRKEGLWALAGLPAAAHLDGTIEYAAVGDPTPMHFALGLLIGAYLGAVIGWPPTAENK